MRQQEALQSGLFAIFVGLFVLAAAGCNDDLYASCQPDEELGCDKGDSYSCIAKPDFQCSTRVCAKYKDSQPFCTQQCSSDGDCAGGACKNFVLGTDEKYCVPSDETN